MVETGQTTQFESLPPFLRPFRNPEINYQWDWPENSQGGLRYSDWKNFGLRQHELAWFLGYERNILQDRFTTVIELLAEHAVRYERAAEKAKGKLEWILDGDERAKLSKEVEINTARFDAVRSVALSIPTEISREDEVLQERAGDKNWTKGYLYFEEYRKRAYERDKRLEQYYKNQDAIQDNAEGEAVQGEYTLNEFFVLSQEGLV